MENIILFKFRMNHSTNYLFNFDTIPISDFSQLKGQEVCPPHKSLIEIIQHLIPQLHS